jgi:hypothetical protein
MWTLSTQSLQTFSQVCLWVATVTGAIAVAAGFFSTVASNRASDAIQAEADKRQTEAETKIADAKKKGAEALAKGEIARAEGLRALAEGARANERAAALEADTAKAKYELAQLQIKSAALQDRIAPRRMNSDQTRSFREYMVAHFAEKSVLITSYAQDVEAAYIVWQIEAVLEIGEIKVTARPASVAIPLGITTGVLVKCKDRMWGQVIAAVFNDNGVDAHPSYDELEPDSEFDIEILVGRRSVPAG